MESPPQDTSELASNHISFPQATAPSNLIASLSPDVSTLSRGEYSAVTTSSSGPLDPAGGTGTGPSGGQNLFMPSEELMSIFGDNDLDVGGLFPPSAFPEFTMDRLGDAPYGENVTRHGSQGSDEIAEIVSSP